MSGAGPGSINSILQETSTVLASLPDVLVYGIGALVIVFAATALLAPNQTTRNKSATTAGRPTSSCSTTSSNSHTESSKGSNSTAEPVTREQSPDTSPEDIASSTPSETKLCVEEHQPTTTSSQTPRNVNDVANEQPKRVPVALAETRTANCNYTTSPRPWRQSRSTINSADSPTLGTRLRRHFVDPVQIETGIDPLSWDSSWGLIKADFSLTGVSADTGGELVYFNAFPSPVSAKPFDSPIEITTTSLIRHLFGTGASSSSPDQQPTTRHSAVSTKRQHQTTKADQNNAEPQTRTHLHDETLETPSQPGSPSFTEKSPDTGQRSSTPLRDSDPQFTIWTDTQESHPSETSGLHSRTGATQRRQADNRVTDKMMPVQESFSNPDVSMTEISDNQSSLEVPTEHQVFDSLLDTEPTKAKNETALQNDQWTPQPTEPPVDRPMQTEMPQQIGLSSLTRSDKHRPGETTLNAALPRNDPVTPVEDLTHGLDAIGIDSTQSGFDALSRAQNSWPETEPLEPVSDPFGVSDAIDTFDDTELFPEVPLDDPLNKAHDDLQDFQEPLFDMELRL